MEWCEDLKIEPVLAVQAGYALRGDHINPGKDLDPYVQAAIDEAEYITGDMNTPRGVVRASEMVIRRRFPCTISRSAMKTGSTSPGQLRCALRPICTGAAQGISAVQADFDCASEGGVRAGEEPDVRDDHYYKSSADMLDFVHHYDDAPRTGPKIFIGEWATLSRAPTPNFGGALAGRSMDDPDGAM